MNKAALNFYETVRREGTQKNIVDTLQTRAELYDFLGYHAYEDKLDALFAQGQSERAKLTHERSTRNDHEHSRSRRPRNPSR